MSEQKPDAYKENWKGTNKKYGIAYDTPKYAKEVGDYTNQFMSGKKNDTQSNNQPQVASQTDASAKHKDALNNLMKIIASAKANQQVTPNQPITPQIQSQPNQGGLLGPLALNGQKQ